MNKSNKLKELLLKALQSSDDFALEEVRGAIRAALSRLEHVEDKRERRKALQATQQWPANNYFADPKVAKQIVTTIDEMIDKEKKKIDEINQRKKQREEDGDATLFG